MPSRLGTGLLIAGVVVAGAAALPILIGFGGAGIAAGSIAAGIQSSIGSVAAGSIFSIFQSLGMTGALSTTLTAGAVTSAVGGAVNEIENRQNNPQANN